jgi:hypothetical protein
VDISANRYAALWPIVYWVLGCIGIAYCSAVLLGFLPYGEPLATGPMGDGYAYWSANQHDPYHALLDGASAFLYSPAFLQAFAPFQVLPWPVFQAVWFGLHVLALWKLRALWMLAIPFVADDAIRGNIHTFMAFALVVPGGLALSILSKMTPGVAVLGGRWKDLAVALGIGLVSFALTPELWFEWVAVLRDSSAVEAGVQVIRVPLLYRLPVAVLLALASRRWPWLLTVSMLVALPNVWPSSFALLAAIPMLANQAVREGLRGNEAGDGTRLGRHGADRASRRVEHGVDGLVVVDPVARGVRARGK